VVICLERGAHLHMAQLQIGFTLLVLAHLGSPGKRAVKWVCVCMLMTSMTSTLVLLFWYQFTQVVLEKRLLNGCSS